MVTIEVKFWVRARVRVIMGVSSGFRGPPLDDDGVDHGARGLDYLYVGGRLRITR